MTMINVAAQEARKPRDLNGAEIMRTGKKQEERQEKRKKKTKEIKLGRAELAHNLTIISVR